MCQVARIEIIFSRRSIRKYTAEPISEADIKTLLEAAMAAGQALRRPEPLFKKLDESVVEEELARIGAAPDV
jgi:nitroreductase